MKIKNVYKIALLLALYVILQSRSGGPGSSDQKLQVTGAPGSTGMPFGEPGTCANFGCHTAGQFNPALTIALLEDMTPVTKYEPGKNYTLRIINTPGIGTPPRFGFQAVALNAANQQSGDWNHTTLPNSMQVVTLSNRKYAEHKAPLTSGTFLLPWIAPAAGTGNVTFYTASIAANNNGESSGDGTAKASLTVEEAPASSVSNASREIAALKVMPNPVGETLNLEITSRSSGAFHLRFLDLGGQVVKMQPLTLTVGLNRKTFDIAELTPGLYIVQLCGDRHLAAAQMLKR